MTDDREAERREIERLRVECAEKRGRLLGSLDARMENLRRDPELNDALRAGEWLRADPSLHLEMRDGRLHGVPEGWPEGVDGDAVVDARLAAERGKMLARIGTTESRSDAPSPMVADFRARVKR